LINFFIEWTRKTFLPYGELGLFVVAFMEASFFPVPPDLLLIVMALAAPEKALLFVAICTIGSVAGAIFGYGIGKQGGLPLLKKFVKEEKISRIHRLFNKYEAWAIFIAALTPIPFKVATIAGGVFYINFRKFLLVSFLSRGLRYFLEGLFIMLFGAMFISFFDKYFTIMMVLLVIVVIMGYFIYKKLNFSRVFEFIN